MSHSSRLIVKSYIHDLEFEFCLKAGLLDDVHMLVLDYYGRKYLIIGIGVDDIFGKNKKYKFDKTMTILRRPRKLFELSAYIRDRNDVFRMHDALLGVNVNGKLFSFNTELMMPFQKRSVLNAKSTRIKLISDGVHAKHVLISTCDDKLYQCGINTHGQCLIGATGHESIMVLTQLDLDRIHLSNLVFAQIKTGADFTLLLTTEGDVYACGRNDSCQCGIKSSQMQVQPMKIAPLSNIKSIYAGNNHNFCVDRDNKIFVFGSNKSGRLGLAKNYSKTTVILQPFFKKQYSKINQKLNQVAIISCGSNFSGVCKSNGVTYLFGCNSFGQVGNGQQSEGVYQPYLLELKCEQISLGECHTLLLTTENQLFTCGSNDNRQCSNFFNKDSRKPKLIEKQRLGIAKQSRIVRIIAGMNSSILIVE